MQGGAGRGASVPGCRPRGFTLGSPRQIPECLSLSGFSGGANTGDPGGKLVFQPQVVTGLPSACFGLENVD